MSNPPGIPRGIQLGVGHDRCRENTLHESLWSSRDPLDIKRFYTLNPTIGDLVRFSIQRRRAPITLKKKNFASNTELVVVVPTIDAKSGLGSNVARLFDPFPIVIVESSGPYFNYATSVNAGIREALKYNPEWIVISNDDMKLIDPPSKLRDALSTVSPHEVPFAVPGGSGHILCHSHPFVLCSPSLDFPPRIIYTSAYSRSLARTELDQYALLLKYRVSLRPRSYYSRPGMPQFMLWAANAARLASSRSVNSSRVFVNPGDFTILKSSLATQETYDDVFINAYEDLDLSLRLFPTRNYRFIDYRIGSIGGRSLSPNWKQARVRMYRDVLSWAYFDYKWKKKLSTFRGCGSPTPN